MLIVSTTGYIIACIGPFLSNYSNNDASIMQNILHRNTDGIRNWLNEDDVIVVDRGFRDCVNAMEDLGLNVVFPPFLNGRKQFTTTAANQSRFVTKVRWVVEAANGRIKQFKFLANTVANSSLPHLEQYLSIVCSIINRYRPPIKTSSIQDTVIADQMISLRNQKKNFEAAYGRSNGHVMMDKVVEPVFSSSLTSRINKTPPPTNILIPCSYSSIVHSSSTTLSRPT
ncbi:unnamed protein product [Rotaria socialis]|uniref:DDE Tnp4 domain-containing protein n=1 Tax=Rotaria socialis TaxID=392032 RepID=A0A817VDH0_9BILA|nr:unnamed protein product [Rotaria socialis]